MFILLLILVLPINNLKSEKFILRDTARKEIIESENIEEINQYLKNTKEVDIEVFESLKFCINQIKVNNLNKEITKIRCGKESNIVGWKEFSQLFGKDQESREVYAILIAESYSIIDSFFSSESKYGDVLKIHYAENSELKYKAVLVAFFCTLESIKIPGDLYCSYGPFYRKRTKIVAEATKISQDIHMD